MLKKIIFILVSLVLVSGIVACGGNGIQSNQRIEATWIEPQVFGDTVSIPVSEVERDWNVHFNLKTQDADMDFMAYVLDGEIYVRANICPPCHSIGFSLQRSSLICDTCATVFDAKTGAGIGGACVAYPKAAVPYEIKGDSITMQGTDLLTAYQDTVNPIQPSEATAPSCHSGSGTPSVPGCCSSTDKPRAPSCCGI
ncbi:MAG: Fe-S-containing protein [Dehalococcoidia bacterium]|nr:Fe-S-containing protein [Dehalococcoidia bacterium]MDH4366815.1 Fe-S-containing protein [Dehalococcoidia bacterium]